MKKKIRKLEASLVFVLKALLYVVLFYVFYNAYARYNFQLRHPLSQPSRTSVIVIFAYIIFVC